MHVYITTSHYFLWGGGGGGCAAVSFSSLTYIPSHIFDLIKSHFKKTD